MYQAILLLPLLGAIFAGFFGRLVGARSSEVITTTLVLITALLSYLAFYQVALNGQEERIELLRWIDSGALKSAWSLRIDTLTAVMLVVVTTVSGLVHLYSIGYMEDDPHRPRFFAYLSLFTFAMLALVTADNFLQLFFGWEGVGLASYLLIGFWYHKPSANAAAIKAFIVNRVGDFGFALGIFAIFTVFNSVQYDTVFASAPDQVGKTMEFLGYQVDALTLICLLLFMGAMGKSAQFLLHTWLPDAMEGPTPVSALIHAATMVTAGVFMVARLSPLFELAPIALGFVTIIGATTAFFAATVGLVQNDIKRVVAYSTCSQLGYMFVAEGVGAYGAGMFHLFTHAVFKALLFLGAGAVIHALHHEQDMRRMGGLRKVLPFTWRHDADRHAVADGLPVHLGLSSPRTPSSRRPTPRTARSATMRFVLTADRGRADLVLFLAADVPRLRGQAARAQARCSSMRMSRLGRWACRSSCSRSARCSPGVVVLAFLHRRAARRSSGGGSLVHPWRAASRGAELGVGRADARHGGRLRHRLVFLHHQPAGAVRRSPSASAAPTCSCSTPGTSTSFTTASSCGRRSGSAASCGRPATARSSTASDPTASPRASSTSPTAWSSCRSATSITTPSPC